MIEILPNHVAERIAAGEVIERPSSVIKELLENAIDARATDLFVRVENGGKTLIEVTDNGTGMTARDLELSIQRHATSKIREVSDLDHLKTLGFRGEALPSIAAVSHLKITSSSGEETFAIESPSFKALSQTTGHFLGSPHGTQIRVTGLFDSVPARLKFLKSDGSETAAIRDWMERLAMTSPKIGFRLESRDRTLIQLRPESELERVRSVLGVDTDAPIVTEKIEFDDGMKIRGYWFQGLSLSQSKHLIQVINGRVLKDRLIQQAIMQAFRQSLLPGQYPALALFIEIHPSELDVNVHPSKTEVRFLDSRSIFSRIQHFLEPWIKSVGMMGFAERSHPELSHPPHELSRMEMGATTPFQFRSTVTPTSLPLEPTPSAFPEAGSPIVKTASNTHPFLGLPYRGTLFHTYLLFEAPDELLLIDQHAADERIRYEKLKKSYLSETHPHSQLLLTTEKISISEEDEEKISSQIESLGKAGFNVEITTSKELHFKGVPAVWGTHSLSTRLRALVDRLIESEETPTTQNPLIWDERAFEKIASEACRSSVMAGDDLEPIEVKALVQSLFETEHPWNCPHGRPTTARVPKGRFEEWFSRRV